MTFKSLIRPFFDYAAAIVYPNYSPTSIKRLQVVQNKCLRQITGSHLAASFDHIHQETQVLPVKDHLHLLSSQYLVRALSPTHPSNHLVAEPPRGPRKMKETLRSKCWDTVSPFLHDDSGRPVPTKEVMKQIHIKIVSDVVDNFEPNRVLNTLPPLIHPSESTLPRMTRAVLSQLRSGHCSRIPT